MAGPGLGRAGVRGRLQKLPDAWIQPPVAPLRAARPPAGPFPAAGHPLTACTRLPAAPGRGAALPRLRMQRVPAFTALTATSRDRRPVWHAPPRPAPTEAAARVAEDASPEQTPSPEEPFELITFEEMQMEMLWRQSISCPCVRNIRGYKGGPPRPRASPSPLPGREGGPRITRNSRQRRRPRLKSAFGPCACLLCFPWSSPITGLSPPTPFLCLSLGVVFRAMARAISFSGPLPVAHEVHLFIHFCSRFLLLIFDHSGSRPRARKGRGNVIFPLQQEGKKKFPSSASPFGSFQRHS